MLLSKLEREYFVGEISHAQFMTVISSRKEEINNQLSTIVPLAHHLLTLEYEISRQEYINVLDKPETAHLLEHYSDNPLPLLFSDRRMYKAKNTTAIEEYKGTKAKKVGNKKRLEYEKRINEQNAIEFCYHYAISMTERSLSDNDSLRQAEAVSRKLGKGRSLLREWHQLTVAEGKYSDVIEHSKINFRGSLRELCTFVLSLEEKGKVDKVMPHIAANAFSVKGQPINTSSFTSTESSIRKAKKEATGKKESKKAELPAGPKPLLKKGKRP